MAITVAVLAVGDDTSTGLNTVTASISPTANKLVMVFVGSSGASFGLNSAPVSVVGAGLTFTKIGDYVSETGWERQTVWCACSASVSTGAITVTFTQNQSQIAHDVIEITGSNASTSDNGVSAVVQMQGVTTGGDNTTLTTTASLAAFANPNNATLMYWNAATKANTPMTTTGSAGLTEIQDYHHATGLGWDIHQSIYFQDTPNQTGVVTATQAASFNAKVLISMELVTLTSGTSYTMTAAAGSYAYAGNAAGLSFGRKLFAAGGSYLWDGSDVSLSFGRKMAADAGSYAYAGAAVAFSYGRSLIATAGSYAYAGADVALAFGRKMAADAGSYVYIGNDVDLIYGVPPAGNEPAFQENAFQSNAYQMAYNEVLIGIVEGRDTAAFTTTSTTYMSFASVEGADVAYFNTTAKTFLEFHLTEGEDVLAVNLDVKTFVTFGVTEGPDLFDFGVLTGAQFTFDLVEGPDVPQFRTFATYWDEGDAFYMYLPYEIQTITLTTDLGSYILIPAEYRIMTVQSEWKRIDVDQQRARRRETT